MELDVIREYGNGPLIISDLGSEVPEDLSSSPIVVIDHHSVSDETGNRFINLNPRKFGYDGTKEACSSTVAFILFIIRGPIKSGPIPCLPCRCHRGTNRTLGGFNGINGKIVEDLKARYPCSKELNLSGKTISEAIYLSIEPYFDGLSGSQEGSRYLLENLSIDPDSPLQT